MLPYSKKAVTAVLVNDNNFHDIQGILCYMTKHLILNACRFREKW